MKLRAKNDTSILNKQRKMVFGVFEGQKVEIPMDDFEVVADVVMSDIYGVGDGAVVDRWSKPPAQKTIDEFIDWMKYMTELFNRREE